MQFLPLLMDRKSFLTFSRIGVYPNISQCPKGLFLGRDPSPPERWAGKAVGVTTHISTVVLLIVHTVHRPCLVLCSPPRNSVLGPLVIAAWSVERWSQHLYSRVLLWCSLSRLLVMHF